MNARGYLPALFLVVAASAAAQPPITVDWFAFRPFGAGDAHIDRDPVTGEYLWAVQTDELVFGCFGDEVALPFDSAGNDLSQYYNDCFNVGSLDHLVDMELRWDLLFYIEYHMTLTAEPYWHLFCGPQEFAYMTSDPEVYDFCNDLLLDGSDVFVAGGSTSWPGWTGEVFRMNTSADTIWTSPWGVGPIVEGGFLAVAAHGDTIAAANFPLVALFERGDGSFIDTLALFPPSSIAQRCGHLWEHNGTMHWAAGIDSTLHYGAWDLATGALWSDQVAYNSLVRSVDLVVDDDGDTWIGFTAENEGVIMRINEAGDVLGTYALYAGVTDLEWSNGKLSITGLFTNGEATTYLVTGTPIN